MAAGAIRRPARVAVRSVRRADPPPVDAEAPPGTGAVGRARMCSSDGQPGHDRVGDRVLGHADRAGARAPAGVAAAQHAADERTVARRRRGAGRARPRTARAGRCRRRRRRRRARRAGPRGRRSSSAARPRSPRHARRRVSASAGAVARRRRPARAGSGGTARPTIASTSSSSVVRRRGRAAQHDPARRAARSPGRRSRAPR